MFVYINNIDNVIQHTIRNPQNNHPHPQTFSFSIRRFPHPASYLPKLHNYPTSLFPLPSSKVYKPHPLIHPQTQRSKPSLERMRKKKEEDEKKKKNVFVFVTVSTTWITRWSREQNASTDKECSECARVLSHGWQWCPRAGR